MTVELSVLVPCFNEQGNLPELVERTERVFDRRGIPGEIILVNDGSIDGTGREIDELAATHERVRAIHHDSSAASRCPATRAGYAVVDLGEASSFAGLDGRCARLRFHHSNPDLPSRHHCDGRHEYSFPKTVLAADLVVSVPKMKTHKKSGVTLSLKNMIGTTNQKYWLPHFTAGAPPERDEFPIAPPLGSRLATFLSRVMLPGGHALVARFPPAERREEPYIYDGNWSGNDTLWRTILDLNRILLYADTQRVMRERPQRRLLSLIDGIVAGEGNGPLRRSPSAAASCWPPSTRGRATGWRPR